MDIHRGDDAYPQSFNSLEYPPEVFYLLGDPGVLQGDHLSIIGARKATPYGLATSAMAGRIAAVLRQLGFAKNSRSDKAPRPTTCGS